MTQQELEKYLWGAATALRGTIDAGDYKQYIFPLLFFKRISDVYEEEYESALSESDNDEDYAAFAENHHFLVPKGSHWNDVREVTSNIGMALQEAMRQIEQANPDTLFGIFGDASWTNKERLPDYMLTDLIEHYSQHKLSLSNVPDDQLGNAYEYLIKEFADDSGHTAAEFYTNRTVVKLMTMIMDPQPGESVYDPTCGSGGLLLNCALHLKDEGKEYRSLKLYGQEINLITSAIARMNMFMHGIEEFDIIRGNTLSNPGLLENDQLKTFNVILANPPYSIKSWDRKSFESDPYGRNIWGTPPQGCADYAFQQHMHKSLDKDNGRCISLWPHGVLFRDSEADMRRQMIEEDLVECVIGLGPNLFYNSPMEACLLITTTNKADLKKGKVLFINAVNEVKQDKNIGFLEQHHIDKIFTAYQTFVSQQDFSVLVGNEEVLEKKGNMAINLYIRPDSLTDDDAISIPDSFQQWQDSSLQLKQSMDGLFEELSQTSTTQSQKSAKKGGGVFLDELDIENFNIDKSDWKKVKLGDVVFEPKESSKDPIVDGIEHVVGLEHIDSEDIHLRRSASLEDASTTFTKKFSKGDVLFGRRRAYLKKAAKANFEGICSGDITVMRAKPGLLPELLPFLINNDKFFDYAVQHSAGGLSPRVKFKDLANYSFLLPSNDTQIKLAGMLWAINSVLVTKKALADSTNSSVKSILYDLLKNEIECELRPLTFKSIPLEDLVIEDKSGIRRGPFGSTLKKEYFVDQGVKVYEQSNVIRNDFQRGNYFIDKEKFEKLKMFEIRSGDILISCSGTVGKVAVVPQGIEKGIMNQALLRARLNEDLVIPKYFKYLFESDVMQSKLLQNTQGSAMKNLVALKYMKKIKFPVVDKETQERIISIVETHQSVAYFHTEKSNTLQNNLIKLVF